MKFQKLFPLALAAGFAVSPLLLATPASAQSYGNDAAIGAAVGALVGTLLFDSNRNQYYYYQNRRPVYVNNGYAGRYFANRDPDYWRAHRHVFNSSPAYFNRGWAGAHDGDRFDRERHDHDRFDGDRHDHDRFDGDRHDHDRFDRDRHDDDRGGDNRGWYHNDR